MAAQRLVKTVMKERQLYPTEADEQVLADLSVDHGGVSSTTYRAAYGISQRAADNQASTEDLRQAMIHYRALFQDLLGETPAATETPVIETTAGLPEGDAPAVGTGRGPGYPEPASDYPAEPVADSEPADEYDAEPAGTGSDVPRQRRS